MGRHHGTQGKGEASRWFCFLILGTWKPWTVWFLVNRPAWALGLSLITVDPWKRWKNSFAVRETKGLHQLQALNLTGRWFLPSHLKSGVFSALVPGVTDETKRFSAWGIDSLSCFLWVLSLFTRSACMKTHWWCVFNEFTLQQHGKCASMICHTGTRGHGWVSQSLPWAVGMCI